jgi:hypothetical protein
MSDTKLLRKSFKEAGFLQRYKQAPAVFNDKHKGGTRRLKLWDGDHVFAAPQFAQQALERALQRNFGSRYLFGQFIARQSWWNQGKSFCVYVLAE